MRASHESFVHSLDRTVDLNQESCNAAIDTGLGIHVASIASRNMTHWDQFVCIYRDDKHLLEICRMESHFLYSLDRAVDLNQESWNATILIYMLRCSD